MKGIKIKNKDIAGVIDVIYKFNLSGIESVHRTRFKNTLDERLYSVQEEFGGLLKEYLDVEKYGNIHVSEITDNMITDKAKFSESREKLFDEEFVIDGANSKDMLKTMKKVVNSSDIEWQGNESDSFFVLYEALESFDDSEESDSKD